MKSTIQLSEHQSLSVEPYEDGKVVLIFASRDKASTTALLMRLTRDQAEILVFGIETALELAAPLPAMSDLATV